MEWDWIEQGDGFRSAYKWGNVGDELRLHRLFKADNSDAVVAANRELRNDGGARNLSFMRPVMRIPMDEYQNLLKINPDLNSPDAETCTRAWKKIAQDGGYRDLTVSEW